MGLYVLCEKKKLCSEDFMNRAHYTAKTTTKPTRGEHIGWVTLQSGSWVLLFHMGKIHKDFKTIKNFSHKQFFSFFFCFQHF